MEDVFLKDYEKLTLRDHFMFGKIFLKEENCQTFLRALFGRDIIIVDSQIEKTIKEYDATKYVRLDLIAVEDIGTIFNAELQHLSKNKERQEELPKRSRYYQAILDSTLLAKGKSYRDLPETYVVFVCTFDPFGKGLAQYSIESKCLEIDLPEYDDYTHKIFFNTTGDLKSLSKEARNMLEYIESGKVTDEATKLLDNEVTEARLKEEWKAEYMLTVVHDKDVFEEGYDSGYDSGYESRQNEVDALKIAYDSSQAEVDTLKEAYDKLISEFEDYKKVHK